MSHKKAIIIGAGIAGLASAVRLAVQGFQVHVFEKNDYPGGKLSKFEKNGYSFDAGPSLFIQPRHIEELFVYAEEPIEDYFSYSPVPISCKYFYEDGTVINAFTDAEKFAVELNEKLGEDSNLLKNYLSESANIYNNIGEVFLNNSLHKRGTFFKSHIRKALTSVKAKYLLKTMHQVNGAAFTKLQTVQLFNRYATYNGSNPYKAPGMLSLIPHTEHNEGVYYPKGGMISITNAIYRLALKKGVKFHFNTPVRSIIYHEDQVKGVVVNNDNHYADIVVSNMDVFFTYRELLKDHRKAKHIFKQERSSSAVVFYWGIKKEFAQLDLHNIFFATDYRAEFNTIFNTKTAYKDPTIYINITSKMERGIHAPEAKENWFVMVNAPANKGQDWASFIAHYRKVIIEKLNRLLNTDIEPLIEVEAVLDPVTIEEKTSSFMGSLYGSSSNSRLAAFLRHPNFTNAIKSLYFVGGTVHPGGGIPLCLQSAKIADNLVKEDFGKRKKEH